jgi:Na+-driven multidrug efflux pump
MLDIPGVVRGCGLQKIGACVNLSAYYLVGVPAALCFAFFYHFGGTVLNLTTLIAYKGFNFTYISDSEKHLTNCV